MKKVTLANEKGGVGKTTLAVNIAAGLALRGKRVLLIDADAQANSTDNLGLEPYPGFYDWLVRGAPPEKVIAPIHPAVYGCESDAPPLTPHELASLDEHDQAARLHQRGLEASRLHLLGSNVETYMIASAIREEGLFARRLDELLRGDRPGPPAEPLACRDLPRDAVHPLPDALRDAVAEGSGRQRVAIARDPAAERQAGGGDRGRAEPIPGQHAGTPGKPGRAEGVGRRGDGLARTAAGDRVG